jgi:putative oxidoreductase
MVSAIRTIARPMLAAIFVVSGLDVLAKPEARAKLAKPVVDKLAAGVPALPADPVAAVSLNAVVHLGAGSLLMAGILPRLSALALAGSVVPTTLAGHRFWEIEDETQRSQQRMHFLKNLAIFGGLLITALD